MNGLVTSRSAVDAASCMASLATRVLWYTCTARYNTDKTTASEPINCEMALIASQFTVAIVTDVILSVAKNLGSFPTVRQPEQSEMFRFAQHDSVVFRFAYFASSAILRTIFPRVWPVATCSCAFIASESGNV